VSLYCSYTDKHLTIDTLGRLKACCFSEPLAHSLDQVDDITDFWHNSKQWTTLRDNLNNGVRDSRCNECWKMEDKNLKSLRQRVNFPHEPGKLQSLELTISNQCNLACRMCTSARSSMIAKERRPWDIYNDQSVHWLQDTNNLEKIEKMIIENDIKDLYLAGGEPQLIKEYIPVMEMCVKNKSKFCNLHLVTNGTVYNEKFFEIVKKFDSVIIEISIDATEQTYNNIRYLGDWDNFTTHTDRILELVNTINDTPYKKASIMWSIVQQLANIDHCNQLSAYFKSCKDKMLPDTDIVYSVLTITDYDAWRVDALPIEILQEAKDRIVSDGTSFADEWKANIENGIKYNVCNSEHISKVFEYEDWYKLKYNQCIWDINPKWKETYQLRQDQ